MSDAERQKATLREQALRWADATRRAREELRAEMSSGARTLAEVLHEDAADPHRGAARLGWVLESRPAVRKIDTRRRVEELGLDSMVPISDLDDATVQRVIDEFGGR